MIHAILEWLSNALLLAGAFFCITGGIGLLRMPDFYTRMHAGSVIDTLGAALILLALILKALQMLAWLSLAKLFFIGMLIFLVSPTASHALARAAMLCGLKPLLGDQTVNRTRHRSNTREKSSSKA